MAMKYKKAIAVDYFGNGILIGYAKIVKFKYKESGAPGRYYVFKKLKQDKASDSFHAYEVFPYSKENLKKIKYVLSLRKDIQKIKLCIKQNMPKKL